MITFNSEDLTVLKTETNYPNTSDIWNKAFDFYNQENEKKQISRTGPRPVYLKVLNFIEEYVTNN